MRLMEVIEYGCDCSSASNPAARKEFANWNIALARDVAAVDGRVLLKENVRMASNNPVSHIHFEFIFLELLDCKQ